MSYKTERGNVAKKGLRFHATAKIALDYQSVTKHSVAASRKRLRSYVLTCFQWFPTFVFQNPNKSKNGDERNGHISTSRKTI